MVNILSFIGIIRQQLFFSLQYGYDVNTTVLNYFTVSAQSKTQCYKASGYLSIDLFMRKQKNEIRKHTTRTRKQNKNLATPGIEFVQIKKALFIYRSADPVKKLVMISTIPAPDTISFEHHDPKTEVL